VLAAIASAAEAPPRDETELWVPSFALYGGVMFQGFKGSVMSGPVTGDQLPTTEQPIRPSASGKDLNVGAIVSGSLEIMSPRFVDRFGRPRAFVHGDVGGYFGFKRDVAKEGVTGPLEPAPNLLFLNEMTILGQGSRTTAETQGFLVTAGAGIAFSFDAFGRRMRIKPSFEYLREKIEVTGVVQRAVQIDGTATMLSDFRLIELNGKQSRVYNGIGPGLELEMDAARAGPVMLTVFFSAQAYRFLGDLDMQFSESTTPACSPPLCTPPVPPETAEWSFEKKPWAYRGGVGVRFRWQPE